jgi:hypothetical protein
MGVGEVKMFVRFLSNFVLLGSLISGNSVEALANGLGENIPWQFRAPNDAAAMAVVRDHIERRKGGTYRPPVTYQFNTITNTTSIERQFNCNNTASALGNSGTTSSVASSPGTTGATSSATGNLASTNSTQQGPTATGQSSSTPQDNSGAVSSTMNGSTHVSIPNAYAYQALNSAQTNSGAQTASVSGSTACGVLN